MKGNNDFGNKRICNGCSGRGRYQVMGEEPCYKCNGIGRDTNSEFWAMPCIACNGSGKKA